MIVERVNTIPLDFYTEGPAIDADGNVYCTTLTGGMILKIDTDKTVSTWSRSHCPNGQVILPNGDHLVCDSREASILRFDRDGVFIQHEIFQTCSGEKISVPNDLVADSNGGIYFTDSTRNDGKVGYRSAWGQEHIVVSGLDYPNGVVLSKDEKTLFVAESYRNRIISMTVESGGIAREGYKVFAELPQHSSGKAESNLPDGMALDREDRLWVAHYGMQALHVFKPNGQLLHSIEIPFPLVSNVFIPTNNGGAVVVTGGYAEPGPGAICILTLKH